MSHWRLQLFILRGGSRSTENRLDIFEKRACGIRFLQESGQSFAGESLDRIDFVVAAAEDDLDVRVARLERSQGFLTAHRGHRHIEQDENNFAPLLLVNGEEQRRCRGIPGDPEIRMARFPCQASAPS